MTDQKGNGMNDPQNDPTTEEPDDMSTPEAGAFGELGFGGGL